MISSKKILKDSKNKNSKQQSAIEYVLSYSWAIIILIAIILIYFYYSNNQVTYSSSYCYISTEFPCYQILINSNSLGTSAVVVFSNNVNKPLYFSSTSFSIKFTPNSQYYLGSCQPTTVLQGERVTCTVLDPSLTLPISSEVTPEFYLTYSECISQNCNSNNKQLISLTTSGSGLSYVYQYNLSTNSIKTTPITYTLNTYSSPVSGGSTSPLTGNYNSGQSVSISENPNAGYTFNDWTCTGTGCYSGTSSNPTVIMDSNIIETANFNQLQSYTLTTNAVPSDGGTVSPSSGSYYSGSQVTISETPASGYVFNGWSCTGTNCYSGTTDSAVITISSNVVETANFQQSIATYTLATNSVPTNGGTTTPVSGSYEAGNSVTITETPASGYVFNGWTCTGAGCYAGTSPSNTIIISANTVETANFKKQTGFYYPVPTYNYPSNQTYFYGTNNGGGYSIGLMSDKYHNIVLNNIGNSYYEFNLNYLTVSNGGYVYSLSRFYNNAYNNYTSAILIINTSTESIIKEALITNTTANTKITNGLTSGKGYSMEFNSSGSLYILLANTSGPYLTIINKTDLQNAISSPNFFYNYNKIEFKNLTNIVGSAASDLGSSYFYTSFIMLGNYAFITNQTYLYILNTTKNNTLAYKTSINTFNTNVGSPSGIINIVSNGNFIYFATDNMTSSSDYNSSIAILNTTSLKITYTKVVISPNNYTVGATLNSNLTDLYFVLSNETVYTFPLTGNGLGSLKSVQNFGSGTLPLSINSQYDLVSSANGTDLYVTTTSGYGDYYEIYNLKSGSQNGILGEENTLSVPNPYANADIVHAPQNNYNIYTTGVLNGGNVYTATGQVSIISTAYLINKENITLPSTFTPTALLYDGNILRIGGYNDTSNSINSQQGLLTTSNTTTNFVNSNIVSPVIQMDYFYNGGYPMTPVSVNRYLPIVEDFSQPTGAFFLTGTTGNINYDYTTYSGQLMSQVFPTNTVLSGMSAVSSNTQASNCPSQSTCPAGDLYLTPYQTIDAFSSMASTSGSVCAAEANYGFAVTQNINLFGIVERNDDITVMSYQSQSQDSYQNAALTPSVGGIGSTAAQNVFNYPLNDTVAATYTASGSTDIQNAAGTGVAGSFSCSNPPSPNQFVTYSYWTLTDQGLLSQTINSIITNPPLVVVNNTQDIYMMSPETSSVAIYNLSTGKYSSITLPSFNTAYIYDYNNRDTMVATKNGTFVFVGYDSLNGCAIATINTNLQKVVKVNYGLTPSTCLGEMIASPDGKYVYGGIAVVTNSEGVFSVYDLTHYNSTFEVYGSSNYSVSPAEIGIFTLPIGSNDGSGANGLGDTTYQRIAISTNTRPAP